MTFDFDKFSRKIHKRHKDYFSISEVKSLLNLGDDYQRDTPISTGKRLSILAIELKGVKSNGEVIKFSQKIDKGIHIWLADNLKGISTLFKVIKLALTGQNDIKPDVKKWLSHILVVFSIDKRKYSSYLDLKGARLSASLFKGAVGCISSVQSSQLVSLFSESSTTAYQASLEKFFFSQFSYYSLKWTQKKSAKDSHGLLEANASWRTYFKSIFLESKDSDKLFYGGQGKKILQILLGLEFTYVINRLTVKKEMLQSQKGYLKNIQGNNHASKDMKSQLKARIVELESLLSSTSQEDEGARTSLSALYKKQSLILDEIDLVSQKNKSFQESSQKLFSIQQHRASLEEDLSRARKASEKFERNIIDLKEFLDVGIFFSGLDIKQCPNCNCGISKDRRIHQKSTKQCLLCNNPFDKVIDDSKREIYLEKIKKLSNSKQEILREIKRIENQISTLDRNYRRELNANQTFQSQLDNGSSLFVFNQKLSSLESQISKEQEHLRLKKHSIAERDKLIAELAVVRFQLAQLQPNSDVSQEDGKLEAKIALLQDAIVELNEKRYTVSCNVLKRLSDIMLSEIHMLGLNSITEIEVSKKFDIQYRQNGEFISFEAIAEGEQLRAKIALYLSLIQLDIEYNFGRHTRFLIIDSPGKEEGDSQYLQGLASVLKNIENRFGSELQIFIGTAERGLSDVIDNQSIFKSGQFLF